LRCKLECEIFENQPNADPKSKSEPATAADWFGNALREVYILLTKYYLLNPFYFGWFGVGAGIVGLGKK